MTPKAVIFDVYNTLLAVGPPPNDAETRWSRLCQALPGPSLSLNTFNVRAARRIFAVNAAAAARGVAFPEVCWPDIAKEVLPPLASLSEQALDDLLYAHAQLQRTTWLRPEAAEVLAWLHGRNIKLGLCSNGQPYTLRELDDALAQAGHHRNIFLDELCFLSFQAGFSKPNPAAFQRIQSALTRMGIAPAEVLTVGDRFDNDVLPAQAIGWQTWLLSSNDSGPMAGGWSHLSQHLSKGE